MAIGCYLLVLLVIINGYSYLFLFVPINVFNGYSINNYWWLFY
jgi:hypothetical protein